MVYFRLTVVLIIGVLQVCTANTISSEEEGDPAKLFSAEELKTANDAGITGANLVEGKSFGFTFEQTIKYYEHHAREITRPPFESIGEFCRIFDPEHKTAINYTNDQETEALKLVVAYRHFLKSEKTSIIRSICDYISQPDLLDMEAKSFGLPPVQVYTYVIVRHFKLKAQKASGVERVRFAKEMCCMCEGLDKYVVLDHSTFSGSADVEVNEFGAYWNRLEAANNWLSIKNVCDFLAAKSPTDKCE